MKRLLFLLPVFISCQLFAQVDFQKPFADFGLKGSITIYDYQAKKWIFSHKKDSQKGTLPASTFKILNSLIALETGVINDENEIIRWPGQTDTVKYGYRPDIYHDMNLKEAFKVSAIWVYLKYAERIGRPRYQNFLERSHYGNCDLTVDDPDFWNFGKLAVSPVEQINLLKGIYEETLPFSARSFEIVKRIMIEEQTDSYILRAKTGWTRDGGKDTGWWVGYVERKDNVFFFATRIIKNRNEINPDFIRSRKEITRTILTQLHILD